MADEADRRRLEDLERENRRLRRAVEELSVLSDLSKEIGASLDSHVVTKSIVRRAKQALRAEEGDITLVKEGDARPMQTFVRVSSSAQRPTFHLNEQVLGWMLLHKKPLLLNDPHGDDRFRGARWSPEVRTLLSVPLNVRSLPIGVLTVYNKKDRDGFTSDDMRLLGIMAQNSAQVIENARLYEEERALRRMRDELHLAAEIQMKLLPEKAPTLEGYDVAGTSLPAENVGGDYFDYLLFGRDRLAVCVADVSGKGLPAALLMSNVQAALRARYDYFDSPSACLATLSSLLYRSTRRSSFVTMVYVIVDMGSHTLAYANAGHNRPLICTKEGAIRRLPTAGLVLGAQPETAYSAGSERLEPGSMLLLYSDGVPEAMNEAREPLGETRLEDALRGACAMAAEEAVAYIDGVIASHAGRAPQHDDMTLLVVKRSGD